MKKFPFYVVQEIVLINELRNDFSDKVFFSSLTNSDRNEIFPIRSSRYFLF